MLFHHASKNRPFHLGTYPMEVLPRDGAVIAAEAARPRAGPSEAAEAGGALGPAVLHYRDLFASFAEGGPAAETAPVPARLDRRAEDIKGCSYFMDADQVGICRIPENAWLEGAEALEGHSHAVVILVACPALPDRGNLARAWVEEAVAATAEMRALEIAGCTAGHIRQMGFEARIHHAGDDGLDRARLAVLAGLCLRAAAPTPPFATFAAFGAAEDGGLLNPYIEGGFALAAISTNYELECDTPLGPGAAGARNRAYRKGIAGAVSGRERARRAKRKSHWSRYPMEQVRRVDRPTTLIIDEEVPRVPQRAAFFTRAAKGDLGGKSQRERARFAFKHPLSFSQLQLIRAMVPHQDGETAAPENDGDRYGDPAANARAVKALSYFLGSDLTGICEIPRYAWFSHREDGSPIPMYHRYAVVMLIDQGYDTMEGASGDDWISGAQSMRGYLRGAEIAGIMGETLRGLGFPSRAQTNADSDVLHIPLLLWAGLGELSRIGELVLNPFVGPRFKSVVLTTDMPMEVDRPIDFGLQYFCDHCHKCDRECPCDAIPHGDKVMFNGYEMWKPDVERCTRYRLTNMRGSACGRCMKTCPLNKVVDMDGGLLPRAASWLGVNAMFLKPALVPVATWLDDRLGNGRRNPVKKWWFDHEIVDGVTVAAKGANEREIDPGKRVDAARQKIAYYHADAMPPPDRQAPDPVDRKAALAAAALVETPAEARRRLAAGGPAPAHYAPVPPAGGEDGEGEGAAPPANPYGQDA